MALSEISPFSYNTYAGRTKGFASWMADFVQSNTIHGRTGWVGQFSSYEWPPHSSNTWKVGVLQRAKFYRGLVPSLNNNNRHMMKAVNQIRKWGIPNSKPYQLRRAADIRKALNVLQSELVNSPWNQKDLGNFLHTPGTIASMSKVYEMFDPHKWTIYDSRVANALACLVRKFWTKNNNKEVDADILCFPVPPRRKVGWQPCEGFHGVTTRRQDCLAFVYASWLLRQVAEILRNNPKYGVPPTMGQPSKCSPLDANWQVYHLEMALWMLGDKKF